MSKALRMSEEQWREDAAKRARWQKGAEYINTTPAPVNAEPSTSGIREDLAGTPSRARVDGKAPDCYHLVALCKAEGLPVPIPEYAFAAPVRKWRADYCWPVRMVIVEIDGAIWSQGRHTRGAGFLADMEKLNAAALLGFRILRYAPNQMAECLRDLRRAFA